MNKTMIPTPPPFLKWIGSKNWLNKEIRFLLSRTQFDIYHEPFLGSGSVYFGNIITEGFLNDVNEELITTYNAVKNSPTTVIELLRSFPQNEEMFYQIRDTKYEEDVDVAARFIYLNKTSFNGLYRVNRNGDFNASYGKREFNMDRLENIILNCSSRLVNATLTAGDYFDTIHNINSNNVVFLDPPYSISEKKGFTRYTPSTFSTEEQSRLRDFIEIIKGKGAKYILTNEYNEGVLECFDQLNDRRLAAKRKSVVAGNSIDRADYSEVIFTNIDF